MTLFLWAWLVTVGVETAVLVAGLGHPLRVRLEAGLWLSSATLPIVWFVIPEIVPMPLATWVSELFAPAAECALFSLHRSARPRDYALIVIANLASFAAGLAL